MKKPTIFDISAMRKEMFKLAKEGRRAEAAEIQRKIREIEQNDTSDPSYHQKKKGKRNK